MICGRNSGFENLSESLGRGFLCDAIILDIAKIQKGKKEQEERKPKDLYSRALDILIEGGTPVYLIQTCKHLRENNLLLILPEHLKEMSHYFTELGKKELIITEKYFPLC